MTLSLIGQEIEVNIESLGGLGDGIAAYNGKPVFVAKACVGDRLRRPFAWRIEQKFPLADDINPLRVFRSVHWSRLPLREFSLRDSAGFRAWILPVGDKHVERPTNPSLKQRW